MKILFVTGPSFSGKSIYIRKMYPEAAVVSIGTYTQYVYAADTNEQLEEIAKNAQHYCRKELQERIKRAGENDTVILEHRLLKKKSRAFYIDAVREVTDAPIDCIVMSPDEDTIVRLLNGEQALLNLHEYEKKKLEIPERSEGFSSVTAVCPDFDPAEWRNLTHRRGETE